MGRTLIYIPIIHTDPDLGSLAADLEEKANSLLGEQWKKHKKTVEKYWKEIAEYFKKKKVAGFKIFQDGLPVEGKAAQAIVDELAQSGSDNYRLLRQLTGRGAILQKTERWALLKEEYRITKNLVAKKNLVSSIFAFLEYKLKKDRLLKERDEVIANQINQELKNGETGVCFLGAYHEVLPKLVKDIKVMLFKNPQKVKEYYKILSSGGMIIRNGHVETIDDLAHYLTK